MWNFPVRLLRRLPALAALVTGTVGFFFLLQVTLSEVGQDVVVLNKWVPDRPPLQTRLWIVEDGAAAWLHHGSAKAPWIMHLAEDPQVTLVRGKQVLRFRAKQDPEAHAHVHQLLRAKYGLPERISSLWRGSACPIMPVRLDAP